MMLFILRSAESSGSSLNEDDFSLYMGRSLLEITRPQISTIPLIIEKFYLKDFLIPKIVFFTKLEKKAADDGEGYCLYSVSMSVISYRGIDYICDEAKWFEIKQNPLFKKHIQADENIFLSMLRVQDDRSFYQIISDHGFKGYLIDTSLEDPL